MFERHKITGTLVSSCVHMNFHPCLWPTCRTQHLALWTSLIVIFTAEVPVQFPVTWAWHQGWCWSCSGSGYSVWVLDWELVWNVWWKPLADTLWHHWEDRPTCINLIWSHLVDLQLFASVGPDTFRFPFACLMATGMMRERIYCPVVRFS